MYRIMEMNTKLALISSPFHVISGWKGGFSARCLGQGFFILKAEVFSKGLFRLFDMTINIIHFFKTSIII